MKLKKCIIFFFSIAVISSTCNAQVDIIHNKTSDTMEIVIPKIDKAFEKFDFQNFDSTKEINYFKLPDGTYKEYQKQSYGYIMRISQPDSYFRIIKKFYQNGNIKEKGLSVNYGGFKKGLWYYFDETGMMVKEENNDSTFYFSFAQLLVLLQREKIPVKTGFETYGFHTSIMNENDASGSRWIVKWLKDTKVAPNIAEKITIDGKTGEIVKRETYKFVNN